MRSHFLRFTISLISEKSSKAIKECLVKPIAQTCLKILKLISSLVAGIGALEKYIAFEL